MTRSLFYVAIAVMAATQPAMAHTVSTLETGIVTMITEHSGGCRKSSPPGKCCHAGSQPLHCH